MRFLLEGTSQGVEWCSSHNSEGTKCANMDGVRVVQAMKHIAQNQRCNEDALGCWTCSLRPKENNQLGFSAKRDPFNLQVTDLYPGLTKQQVEVANGAGERYVAAVSESKKKCAKVIFPKAIFSSVVVESGWC